MLSMISCTTKPKEPEKGIDCMVVNPADVPTKNKERAGEADRGDCRKLARGIRNGEFKGFYVPS
jgi:hypothetical protein